VVPRAVFAGDATRTRTPLEYPREPAFVELTFEHGSPVAINAIPMPLVDLVGSLDVIAAAHGVGRFDGLETPGATVLTAAHRAVEGAAASDDISRRYAALIESGRWFSADRESLDAILARAQDGVSGIVRLKLYQGRCDIVERRDSATADVWRLAPMRSPA
jgi:argininosuccinate synthase